MKKSIYGLMLLSLIGLTTSCGMFEGFLGGGGKESGLIEEGQLVGVLDREGWYQELPYGMVAIEGGTFFMGQADEDVAATQINMNRQVTVSAFYMDAEEITNNEYRQFLYDVVELTQSNDPEWNTALLEKVIPNPKVWEEEFTYHYADRMRDYYFEHQAFDNYPVVGVSWEAAEKFAEWRTITLNRGQQKKYEKGGGLLPFGKKKKAAAAAAQAQGVQGQVNAAGNAVSSFVDDSPIGSRYPNFRLPTEAEWEYAAKGRDKEIAKYPWGGPYTRNKDGCFLANFKPGRGAYDDDGHPYTAPVNSFLPNGFGLYNMAGNVAEWCRDDFTPVYNALVWDLNPLFTYQPEESGNPHYGKKVVRGGGWNDISHYLQTATRSFEYSHVASSSIGFRCAMDYLGQEPTN